MSADVLAGNDRPFPDSLLEFQRIFPDDAACATYLEEIRWREGFICMWCAERGEPFRFANRPHVLRCRKCRKDSALTAGTVMERTHTPLSKWFWGAYLASSLTPGLSAIEFQRQLGLTRYETAFDILHKLRAGMARPDRDKIGGTREGHVEVDETWIGGPTRGNGRGVDNQTLVIAAVEVLQRRPEIAQSATRDASAFAGRIRLEAIPDRTEASLIGFIAGAVEPGATVITDAWSGYASLANRGYGHLPAVDAGDPASAEKILPVVQMLFSDLKSWLRGYYGVSPQHLQTYLNEFAFRSNSRFRPVDAFQSLLGISGNALAPTVLWEFNEPPPDETATEGGVRLMLHLGRERDQSLVAKFKASLKSYECSICGFDFEKTYGELGVAFIEAHHIRPLSEGGERKTHLGDLRAVCSNCHRMLHRQLGISIDDLRNLLKRN